MITLVSLLPRELSEEKVTLIPRFYGVPAAKNGELGILHIGDASFWQMLEAERGGPIQQIVKAEDVAKSIIMDFNNAQLEYRFEQAQPGLFFVEGKFDSDEIKVKFPELVTKYKVLQENWFKALVDLANSEFSRTRQIRVVSDLQRMAAIALGMKPEWLIDHQIRTLTCPLCMTNLSPGAAICHVCKAIIDPAKVAKFTFVDKIAS